MTKKQSINYSVTTLRHLSLYIIRTIIKLQGNRITIIELYHSNHNHNVYTVTSLTWFIGNLFIEIICHGGLGNLNDEIIDFVWMFDIVVCMDRSPSIAFQIRSGMGTGAHSCKTSSWWWIKISYL